MKPWSADQGWSIEGQWYASASHVDLSGVARPNYRLVASDSAVQEARRYLEKHKTIEVWNGSRRVARLTRE
jgi:hypothetical protein